MSKGSTFPLEDDREGDLEQETSTNKNVENASNLETGGDSFAAPKAKEPARVDKTARLEKRKIRSQK